MIDPISDRGSKICRICDSTDLHSILDLGLHPIPSEYGLTSDSHSERFPLNLSICRNCGLGQIAEYVAPERIFHKEYPYISSVSSTWIKHTNKYVKDMIKELQITQGSLIVEIASNDGSLLAEFKRLGMNVLGIEPAPNVAALAKDNGVPTIVDFFGEKQAEKIIAEFGHPKLIVANNVFAHVPDIQDFTKGLAKLANNQTTITIENPSFINLLNNSLFDTIYHEHYSYLTAHSVSVIAQKFGLNLIKIEKLETHGGSNRYWLRKINIELMDLKIIFEEEKKQGLFNPVTWNKFASEVENLISGLKNWFIERKYCGDVVVGYGAAHKGNTFLNAVGEDVRYMRYIVDASPEKHGKFLPGSQIEVVSPGELGIAKPTDVLIMPWNIADEIAQQISRILPSSRIWIAQPSIQQISIR